MIAQSLAYVQGLHRTIRSVATEAGGGTAQRMALGQLCHTVQDFYAHSNYIDLWLAEIHAPSAGGPEEIDGLAARLLNHPELRSGHFRLWRDFVYHIPVVRGLARRVYVPPGSHEEMHLDAPSRGPKFYLALEAARQRTRYDYERATQGVLEAGGEAALHRFRRDLSPKA